MREWFKCCAMLTFAGVVLCFVLSDGEVKRRLQPDHRVNVLVKRTDCREVATAPLPQGFVLEGDCKPLMDAAVFIG